MDSQLHPQIRAMTLADAPVVIALNQSVVRATSPMDNAQFSALYALSDLKLVAQIDSEVTAFILGMSHGNDYDNGNYQWFSEHLQRFLYIDRVVVSDKCRGIGIGRLLYARIYKWAKQSQLPTICAEINIDPPNHQSLRFHDKAGFVQIGTRLLENGKKVSMQIRPFVVEEKNES